MIFMVIGTIAAAIVSVSFLIKIHACKGDIIANAMLLTIAALCCFADLADRHYVKNMSEKYDIIGSEVPEEYRYCGMINDFYTFEKTVFMSPEGKYAASRDKVELPLLSRLYKPVRFICAKGSRLGSEKIQPEVKGEYYTEINYNNIIKIVPKPHKAIVIVYFGALTILAVYDLSRLFLMGIRNGLKAYEEHGGKDMIDL